MADNNEFPKKYMSKIEDLEGFVDGINGMDTDDIKKAILVCEGRIYEVDQAKQNDEELEKARLHSRELAAPYRETAGIEKAKMQYMIFSLEQRGISL
jgi:hypothetical protein